jgi:hypothetical protein
MGLAVLVSGLLGSVMVASQQTSDNGARIEVGILAGAVIAALPCVDSDFAVFR